MSTTTDELANMIKRMVDEIVDEKMKVIEDTYFAKSKQTLFTKAQLAEKWGCSVGTVDKILKNGGVEPVAKRGKNFEYPIVLAQEAKDYHDSRGIKDHQVSVRARAIKT
jgi:hypothetical protein|nr:MAG TPA: Protein of unknown function (DUF3853) [Caudoviricetes sp.]